MKTLTLLALSLSLVAGSALADDPTVDHTSFVSTKTRAEVIAERMQFKKSGAPDPTSIAYNPLRLAQSTKTRAEVVAELMAARASGESEALTSEDSGSNWLARARTPSRSAAPVLMAGQAGR
jgi:hypothetical protein